MQVKELAVRLQEELAKAQAEEQKLDAYIELESQYTLKELQALIKDHLESKAILSIDTAQPFKEFLQIRWDRIKSTDAIYTIKPDSPANKVCLFLAEQLASVTFDSQFGLLMPTLDFDTASKLTSEDLYKVIIADDNARVIDIQSCMDTYRSDGTYQHTPRLKYTTVGYGKDGPLTKEECQRVVMHDSATYLYADKVKSGRARTADYSRFKDALSKNVSVGSSYGEKGKARLANQMHALYQFKNANNLIRYVADMPQEQKQAYFDGFNKDALKALLLEDKTLVDVLKINPDFDETMQRSWLDCLVEHYWKERSAKGSYTSLPGMAFGLVGLAYSKGDKELAVSALQALLRSDKSLSEIKEAVKHSEHKGAIMDGALGLIAKKAIELGELKAEEVLQPTGSALGL